MPRQTYRLLLALILSCGAASACSDDGGGDPVEETSNNGDNDNNGDDNNGDDNNGDDNNGDDNNGDNNGDDNNGDDNNEPDAGMENNDPQETALLDEALDCDPRPGTGVTPGDDLKKITLDAPGAICNDGSPAVMFVRRAANDENLNNWVFHLQGGGACGAQDCAARWCDRNEKMTSTATPPGMRGKGIMSRNAQNTLGDANQVFFYYCSSDNWAAQSDDVVVPAGDENPDFRLNFHGESIYNAGLDALIAGATSDDGTVTMPPFQGNGFALWTGTSGGCQGVANTADRFAARATAQGFSPFIVCDANFGPSPDDLPAGQALDNFVEDRARRFQISSEFAKPLRDESCMELLADDPSLCELSGYALANHVTGAPLFVRMDLGDQSIGESYFTAGFSQQEFGVGVRTALLSAAAGEGVEATPRPISVYGPACRQHVGLTNDEWFLEATINIDDVEVTFHDAVVAWMQGRDVVAVDTAPPSLSTCGTPTDDRD